MYHEDGTVNDIILTIINDGDGRSCGGFDYRQRCEAGRTHDLYRFRWAAREYGRYRHRTFGSPLPTREQAHIAGDFLFAYYQEHAEEVAQEVGNF